MCKYVRKLLAIPIGHRNLDSKKKIKSQIAKVGKHLLDKEADVVFTTVITSDSDELSKFRNRISSVFIDEGSSVIDPEIIVPWKGNLPCFIAGDFQQIGPYCVTGNIKYDNGKPVNPFADPMKYSLLQRLYDNDWPCWTLPEQCRIEPGLFDPANDLFYDGKIEYHPSNTLTAASIAFERWAVASVLQAGTTLRQARAKVLPVVLGVRNASAFVELGGTSKGNCANIHYGILALKSLLAHNPLFSVEGIVIICQYSAQCRLWQEALLLHSELVGITISTVDPMQGRENMVIVYDMTAAAAPVAITLPSPTRSAFVLL